MYTSSKPYFYGTGRRKKSVARVRLYPGTGVVTINGRNIDEYFLSTHFRGLFQSLGILPISLQMLLFADSIFFRNH